MLTGILVDPNDTYVCVETCNHGCGSATSCIFVGVVVLCVYKIFPGNVPFYVVGILYVCCGFLFIYVWLSLSFIEFDFQFVCCSY